MHPDLNYLSFLLFFSFFNQYENVYASKIPCSVSKQKAIGLFLAALYVNICSCFILIFIVNTWLSNIKRLLQLIFVGG